MVCNYIYLSNKTSDYIVPLTTKMIVFWWGHTGNVFRIMEHMGLQH